MAKIYEIGDVEKRIDLIEVAGKEEEIGSEDSNLLAERVVKTKDTT